MGAGLDVVPGRRLRANPRFLQSRTGVRSSPARAWKPAPPMRPAQQTAHPVGIVVPTRAARAGSPPSCFVSPWRDDGRMPTGRLLCRGRDPHAHENAPQQTTRGAHAAQGRSHPPMWPSSHHPDFDCRLRNFTGSCPGIPLVAAVTAGGLTPPEGCLRFVPDGSPKRAASARESFFAWTSPSASSGRSRPLASPPSVIIGTGPRYPIFPGGHHPIPASRTPHW